MGTIIRDIDKRRRLVGKDHEAIGEFIETIADLVLPFYRDLGPQTGPGRASGHQFSRLGSATPPVNTCPARKSH